MNNVERFRQLFIEFEKETKKRAVNSRNKTLSECIKELQKYEPYCSEEFFIDFCREIRNINSHEQNDNYYLITDETVERLEHILYDIRNPHKVLKKSTINIYSKKLNDKVLPTMEDMNKYSYTHIPIYSNDNKSLEGVFSDNSLFQYIMEDGIIEIDDNTTFNDIRKCIDINRSKEIVVFVSKEELYDDVVNRFIKEFKDKNKLSCVMVTHNGKSNEKVLGILTAWDIIGR